MTVYESHECVNAVCTPDMLCCGVLLKGLSQEGQPGISQVLTHKVAFSSIHTRYECEMRLYELLPMEGKDMFGYFLALRWISVYICFSFLDYNLRAITQRNLDYFLEHQQMFEVTKYNFP